MATAPAKSRIDVDVHTLLKSSDGHKPVPVAPKAFSLPEPVFPQCPEKLTDPGPDNPPEGNRKMGLPPALSHDAWLAVPVCKVTCVAW